MKTKFLWLTILFISFVQGANAQPAKPVWKELKAFHSLMSAGFHPAEEGNFAPLIQKADSLLVAAKNWQASPIPADFKPAETKAALEKLVAQCARLKKAVDAKASNEVLLKQISEAHDVFHTIVGECRKAEE
jgi:hypothetical protein